MPSHLLTLRFLNNSASFAGFYGLKYGITLQSFQGISIFSRLFPLKPKHLGTHVLRNEESGIRRFSDRSFRSRNGADNSRGVGRSSEFRRGRGVVERGESQAVSFGGRIERGKSLVEDEAELSDWLSELKTSSFHAGLNTDDSDMESDRRKGKDNDMSRSSESRVSSSFMKDQRGRSDVFPSSKRQRGSDSDGFGVSNRGSYRSPRESSSRNFRSSMSDSVPKRQISSESDEDEDFSPRRRLMESDSDDFAVSNRRNSRRLVKSSSRNSKGSISGSVSKNWFVSESEEEKNSMSGFGDLLSGEDSEEVDDDSASSFSGSSKEVSVSTTPRSSTGKSDSYLSETRFDQCAVSPLSLKGLKAAGYERMTVVQEATLPVILKGKDVLAKAKTGTGKTVAFLVPSIEVVVKLPSMDRDQRRPPFIVLVICPTRELASQAAVEANTLLRYHPSIGVQVVIGGTRLALEQKRMQANPCQILVATPGRLRDHTENTAGFATRLMGVKVLVLDEADHLLDMGFRKDVEKIIASVPKQRQTLLFSATVPEEVRQVCHIALKRDHEFINTVEEGNEETNSQVRQLHLVAPLDKQYPLLYVLLKEHISENVDYKVLVFCTTAMVTSLVADLLSELNLNVREIHSRKPQSYRTRVSDEFRKSKGLILVTSDVSARGVDYPDVTLVVQVGLPSDREQYIHRLGRTGRKGKEGQGILLLAPWEEFFLSAVKDLPITKAPVPSVDPDTRKKVERALSHVEMKSKEAAYQAWLGYYNSNKNVGRDKCRLVELANEFSRSMGLDNPPAIPKLVLGKMGLRNVPGLRSR